MSDRGSSGTTQMNALLAEKSHTRVGAAIKVTVQRRQDVMADVSPTIQFVVKVVRKALLGIPATGGGCIWLWQEKMALAARLLKADRVMVWGDAVAFVPPTLIIFVGVAFLAPGETEAVARFFGLGGIIDKVIDRLPFLKAKSPEPAPTL